MPARRSEVRGRGAPSRRCPSPRPSPGTGRGRGRRPPGCRRASGPTASCAARRVPRRQSAEQRTRSRAGRPDRPPRAGGHHLDDLRRLARGAVDRGGGEEAHVVRQAEVGHQRVEEQAPGRRAGAAVLEWEHDVEPAHRRCDEVVGLRTTQGRRDGGLGCAAAARRGLGRGEGEPALCRAARGPSPATNSCAQLYVTCRVMQTSHWRRQVGREAVGTDRTAKSRSAEDTCGGPRRPAGRIQAGTTVLEGSGRGERISDDDIDAARAPGENADCRER